MPSRLLFLAILIAVGICHRAVCAEQRTLFAGLKHLRNVEPREWNEFPEQAGGTELTLDFAVTDTFQPLTLRLRQRDLKQLWRVSVDEREIAKLPRDENAMVTFWPLPESLSEGQHTLRIHCSDKATDDVELGDVRLDERPLKRVLNEVDVQFRIVDPTGRLTPGRLTIVDESGALMSLGTASSVEQAIRPGVIYTATGEVRCSLPAGRYTIYAGRGFEYSLAQATLTLPFGQTVYRDFVIEREVPTDGWVACDPHVHTLTFSGHGDCTLAERVVTLLGEGIELPIATDHNVQIDYRLHHTIPPGLAQPPLFGLFSPIIGNEVTTKVGHFNVFPLPAAALTSPQGKQTGSPPLDYRGTDWQQVRAALQPAGEQAIVILNHARDLHSGFRPFAPSRHIAIAGEDREGWQLPANAMEVINSGATQTDPTQLFHDWLGLLNRGHTITPMGSSDSHDVAKHFVGQGRTYVQLDDRDPSQLDAQSAIRRLREGRVMFGSGLLCRVQINDRAGPGDLATHAEQYTIAVEALGPHWVNVERVQLFVNGTLVEQPPTVADGATLPRGVRWRGEWRLSGLKHDAHVTALATGPGVTGLYWPIAKPYQPLTPDGSTHCIGSCGVVRIDGDGDGRYRSPFDYARQLVESTGDDMPQLVERLADYDRAVAVQAASVVRAAGGDRYERLLQAVRSAPAHVKHGVLAYHAAWREGL